MLEAPTPPRVRVLGPDRFKLLERYVYRWTDDATGVEHKIIVCAWFVFDYASVPRIIHALVGRLDLGLVAPLIHDWIYRYAGELPRGSHMVRKPGEQLWEPASYAWTRKQADKLFGRHMREENVVRWRRRMAYRAVRLFGWNSWGGTEPEFLPPRAPHTAAGLWGLDPALGY